MPLSPSALKPTMKSAILAELQAKFPVGDAAAQGTEQEDMASAIAEGVCSTLIPYLIENAEVMPTALISGSPGAPVTGKGTIS